MSTPTLEQIKAGRKCWRAKLPENPQCESCPFKTGNDKQFGKIVERLQGSKPTKGDITYARQAIKRDLQHSGDFSCHVTAYDKDMNIRPREQHRQCAGATKWWRDGGNLNPDL